MLQDVVFRLQQLVEVHSETRISFGDCVSAARRLGAMRLLLTELGGKRLSMKLSLNVPFEDIVHMLQNHSAVPWFSKLNF